MITNQDILVIGPKLTENWGYVHIDWDSAFHDYPNLSDYEVVVIDLSQETYFDRDHDWINTIRAWISQQKFLELLSGGTQLYIISQDPFFLNSLMQNFITIKAHAEKGKNITTSESPNIKKYFIQLKEWKFCFTVGSKKFDSFRDLKFATEILACNKVGKLLGVVLKEFYLDNAISAKKTFLGDGKIILLHSPVHQKAIKNLIEANHPISNEVESPEWITKYEFQKTKDLSKSISQLQAQKRNLSLEIQKKQKKQDELYFYRQLLWKIGKTLEKVVYHFFNDLLKIKASPPTDMEEDGSFVIKDLKYLIEVKSSKLGSTRFDEFSKLVTRLQYQEKPSNIKAIKGLFIMNHFAKKDPSTRGKPFDSRIERAACPDIILLTTVDLFEMARKLIDGNITKRQVLKHLLG